MLTAIVPVMQAPGKGALPKDAWLVELSSSAGLLSEATYLDAGTARLKCSVPSVPRGNLGVKGPSLGPGDNLSTRANQQATRSTPLTPSLHWEGDGGGN